MSMKKRWFALFTVPLLFVFIVVVIIPFLTGVYYSFVSWDGLPKNPMKFVGLANYMKAFQDTRFLNSLERTTIFTLITMVTVNVLALGFALVVTSKLRLRNVGRVMIFMPYLIGGLLLGYIWQFILGDCMATLGEMTGRPDLFFYWLSNKQFAFIGLISTIGIAITSGIYDANNSDPSTIASKLGLGVIALLVIILTSMTANAVNLLGAGSALANIFPKLSLKHALWVVVALATLVTFIPMFVGSFLATFETFLDYVAMVLGPTIAIICTDFYLLAHRHYRVSEFGKVNGAYWYRGGVNPAAIITFIAGVVIFLAGHQLPIFVNTIGMTFIDMLLSAALYAGLSRLLERK